MTTILNAFDSKLDVTLKGAVNGLAELDASGIIPTSQIPDIVTASTGIALDLKANIESPSLTGTPLAPTATAGTNTTQIATTAYVLGEISSAAYAHPSDGVDLGVALTGATVISDVTVNAAGHVTGFATRDITLGDIGATANSGTVTSVGGTGTVNGISLTGTVTTSGDLTLGGTLSGISNSQLTNSSITIGTTAIALGASSLTLGGLTSVSATTFTGDLTGDVTGNIISSGTTPQTILNKGVWSGSAWTTYPTITADVTGNVTGDVTGNIKSSGTTPQTILNKGVWSGSAWTTYPTITANVTGTADKSIKIETTASATNATHYLTFVSNTTNQQNDLLVDGGISYNPSSNILNVSGSITGNLTGDVTGNIKSSGTTPQTILNKGVWSGSAWTTYPTITANVTGTADKSVQIETTASATDASYYLTFVSNLTNQQNDLLVDGGISYNPSTNVLTATTFAGNASSATIASTVAANSVTLGTDTTGDYVGTVSGTANEIQVTGGSGEGTAITIGLPDNVTITGNLTVNGTTITANSTTVTIDDPVFTLGGDTAPIADDNKDRGIEFRYFDTAARVGFFGYDDSTNRFTAMGLATNTGEVFSGTTLDAEFSDIYATGTKIQAGAKEMFRFDDEWLRINPANEFTSGIYCNTGILRTDGDFQVGSGGASFNVTSAGVVSADSTIQGTQLKSTIAIGTAPLTVVSTTKVTNLNADLLDGLDSASANTGSTIVARDASGDFAANIITAALSGNASTASAWANGRTITLSGDVSGTSPVWTGSGNLAFADTVVADDSHNHTTLTGITSLSFAAEASDVMSISRTINATGTYFDFNLSDDNNNDWWRWRFTPSASTVYDAMILKPVSNGIADLTVTGTIQGTQLKSTIAIGTAPLTVVSTTKVTNLNSDLLDGQTGSWYQDWNNLTNQPGMTSFFADVLSTSVNQTIFTIPGGYTAGNVLVYLNGVMLSETTDFVASNGTTVVLTTGVLEIGEVLRVIVFGTFGIPTSNDPAVLITSLKTIDGAGSGLDADMLDGQDGIWYQDWTNTTNKPDPTITLAGDLSGSVTLTDVTSGTLNATIVANSVALGTSTTGNYVATVVGTANEVEVSGAAGEGTAITVGLPNDVTITGTLSAASKSFLIPHPSKEGKKLRHGSLEGPENGVYIRGRLFGTDEIELPDFWKGLVNYDTITVHLTTKHNSANVKVGNITEESIEVVQSLWSKMFGKKIDCYYTVYAERNDIAKLIVEE